MRNFDKKGQLSAEFVLLLGFMLIIVLLIASLVGTQNQLDQVMSTAKIAATSAGDDIAYNNTGNIIRFNSIKFSNGVINITMYSQNALNTTQLAYIKNCVLNNVSQALGIPVTNGTIRGQYNYTVIVGNVI